MKQDDDRDERQSDLRLEPGGGEEQPGSQRPGGAYGDPKSEAGKYQGIDIAVVAGKYRLRHC